MTTRTKISITIYTWSTMILLNVFSKPLHISDAFQSVLGIGVVVPLGLTFYFIKKQKQERREQSITVGTTARPVTEQQRSAKRSLIWMMVLGSTVGLCAPFLMPLTGSSLGTRGDLICGVITAVIICAIFGFRLKRL